MEDEKLKNWLDLTKQYAADSFWKEVFNQSNHPFSNHEKVSEVMTNRTKDSKINSLFPRCDMFEKDNHLIIEVEFPGIAQDDFTVILKGQDLTFAGKYSTLRPKIHYYLKEREDRDFEKTIILPVKVNKAGIYSSLENGLLTIILPIIREEDAVPVYIDLSVNPIQPHD
jgi:HSP20 family protein